MNRDLAQTEIETLRQTVEELTHRLANLTDEMVYFALPGIDQWNLTKHERAIAKMLYDRKGQVVRKDRIMTALYAARVTDDEIPEEKIIDVFVCKLRKKLKGTGWQIKTAWGVGYSLHDERTATDGV